MLDFSDPEALRRHLLAARCNGASIGFVPTMGSLHRGHVRLMETARAENDLVVISIYVNPAQFGPGEDFERYPRDIENDRRFAQVAGVDVVFLPETEVVYPGGVDEQAIWIEPGSLAAHLCGASRPGHFRGVSTVVAKLFNMVQPDRAYFGQKDAQQALIITRMVNDLSIPVTIRMVETVREPDGLALSSRNVYLTPEERSEAAGLKSALDVAAEAYGQGVREASELQQLVIHSIERDAVHGRIDYVEVADVVGLQPISGQIDQPALLAVAVYFGRTRLIDNVLLSEAL